MLGACCTTVGNVSERKNSVTEAPAYTRSDMMAVTAFVNSTWEEFPRVWGSSQGMLESSRMVWEAGGCL